MFKFAMRSPHIKPLAALDGLRHLRAWREEKSNHVHGLVDVLRTRFHDSPSTYDLVSQGPIFAYLDHLSTSGASVDAAKALVRLQGVLVLPDEFFGQSQSDYVRVAKY